MYSSQEFALSFLESDLYSKYNGRTELKDGNREKRQRKEHKRRLEYLDIVCDEYADPREPFQIVQQQPDGGR